MKNFDQLLKKSLKNYDEPAVDKVVIDRAFKKYKRKNVSYPFIAIALIFAFYLFMQAGYVFIKDIAPLVISRSLTVTYTIMELFNFIGGFLNRYALLLTFITALAISLEFIKRYFNSSSFGERRIVLRLY